MTETIRVLSDEERKKIIAQAQKFVTDHGSPVEVAAVLNSTIKTDDQPKSYTGSA